MGLRICRYCSASEEEVDYYDPTSKSGIAAGKCCKKCWVQKSVEWRKINKDSWNLKRHQKTLETRHGLTKEQFEELYTEPSCAGCGKSEDDGGRRLSFDHCHSSGDFRGLLCKNCNLILGNALDNPTTLRNLANYLER